MASRFVRSIFWIVACSGISYGLLILTTPSEAEIHKRKQELTTVKERNEHLNKNQQFMNVLISATDSNKPLYRLSKDEIEKELKKN